MTQENIVKSLHSVVLCHRIPLVKEEVMRVEKPGKKYYHLLVTECYTFQALINLVSVKAPRLERRLENLEVEINLFECLEWVAMSELNMKVCT